MDRGVVNQSGGQAKTEGIRFISWNICRGLHAKESEIRHLIQKLKIDVVFLQEIDILDFCVKHLNLPGFQTFIHSGDKKRTCTLVRNEVFQNVTQINENNDRPEVWLRVEEKGGRKTTLANIYREWGNDQQKAYNDLIAMTEDASMGRLLMAGDFNLDPSRLNDNSYGSRTLAAKFMEEMGSLGMSRTSFGLTFCRLHGERKIQSELDWALTNHGEIITNAKMVEHSLSDHNPIVWTMATANNSKPLEDWVLMRNYKTIKLDKFEEDLVKQPWELLAKGTTQQRADKFNELLLNVLDKHARLRTVRIKHRKTPAPSERLKKLRRQRDNARSKGLRVKLRNFRTQCTKLTKRESANQARERIRRNPLEVWKMMKEVLGNRSTTNTIKEQGQTLSNREASEKFNEFFLNKVRLIQNNLDPFHGDNLQGTRKRAERLNIQKNDFAFKTVGESDIVKAIQKMKNSKCPDIFGIAPAALKLAPEILATPLAFIINDIIREGEVPEIWKRGRVIPMHKKKAKDNMENYRPVCILPTASKPLEDILRQQLSKYLKKNGILPKSQYGFRPGLSTTQAVGAAHHDWLKARQNGQHCGALFFDLSAAFDTLDADLLTGKLTTYGVKTCGVSLLRSFLTGRKQCTDYGKERSELVEVGVGSPQGSILSPLLFLVMVADLEEWITKGSVLSYADDTTCYCVGTTKEEVRKNLTETAEEVLDFMKASRLSANPTKTRFLMFGRSSEEPLLVGNSLITESKAEPLLGFAIAKDLSWKYHLDNLVSELRKRIGILRRLAWLWPKKVVLKMIEPIFTSKLRYGIELTTDVLDPKDPVLDKLCSLHRSAIKAVLKLPQREHMDYNKLLAMAGQDSIKDIAFRAATNLAWACGQDWQEHALTKGRITAHQGRKVTRQATMRSYPPQPVKKSIVTRIIEIWEGMPQHIKEEENRAKVRKLIRNWHSSHKGLEV